MKTVILTGGGTAGHITPNIALIPKLLQAGFTVHYIGLKGGMEEKLVAPLGVQFHGITGGKLRRYADLKNVTDVFKIGAGFFEAGRLIRKIRPDVVFSKGGFVSTPVVWAASLGGVPVVIHESDSTVGLANRLSVPFAAKVCHTFPETAGYLPKGKGVWTGLPIRPELLSGSRSAGLALCGFTEEKPVIVVTGGSQGSGFINGLVRGSLDRLLEIFQVCHICGKGNLKPELEGRRGYRQFEYVTEKQPDLFAMADIFITRGGATSIFEILELKKPNIIIPYSKKASRGDQIINAQSFKKQGFSEVLAEVDEQGAPLTQEAFLSTLTAVYNDRSQYITAMGRSSAKNGLENVFRVICETADTAKKDN
ncbi:MAG: undecaprenyldiphospho-muramoylpentapeptide beta-N-acetylglucosaminyltransferase [Clostridia bacterium]|nr:undecaprenyldiphospho-muramoylpentapeptide beta-N-acetylglucosaminyltransferase [Clostridia bacterium]MDR3644010.1 undecaprenyldiphospho-muramoylpentapeptide beta-N-acetylglucosaminyltransferase [Clostridia bacterium]